MLFRLRAARNCGRKPRWRYKYPYIPCGFHNSHAHSASADVRRHGEEIRKGKSLIYRGISTQVLLCFIAGKSNTFLSKMAGFDQAGLPGTEFILNGLINAQDFEVVNFVENFQQENSIMLPSLQSALPFLDLHGVRRLEFNKFVMDNLREKLLEQLKKLEAEKLQALLDQSFPFIHVPHLRPVVIEVMKYLPKVPEECLEQLANDPKLYEDCAIEVKRQIWVKHHALFGDAVGPLLNQYVEAKYSVLFSTEPVNSHTFFSVPSKTRRQNTVVQSLAKMIGKSLELYNLVLQFLRTLFLRTKEVHYCTLRSELLMAVHDLEIKDIKDIDPCHKFTWCLDACIRERVIEGKRTKELQGFLDHAKHSEEQVLG